METKEDVSRRRMTSKEVDNEGGAHFLKLETIARTTLSNAGPLVLEPDARLSGCEAEV